MGFAEHQLAIAVAHGEQGDLIVEIDETLDNDPIGGTPRGAMSQPPRLLRIVPRRHGGLSLAGRTHHRLHDARHADVVDRGEIFLLRLRETISGGRNAEFLRCEPADAFAIHGQARRPRGRHDVVALAFQFHQCRRRDGFDFRHDQARSFRLDHRAQRFAIQHVDGPAAMRDLHGGRIGVAVDGDDFNAEALQGNHDLLAQFPRAEQHHPRRRPR